MTKNMDRYCTPYFKKIFDLLDTWLTLNVIDGNVPVFAVAMCTRDGVVFNRVYESTGSVSSPEQGKAPLFNIGSISKTLTATAILKLAEQNKLSLGDRLLEFFPEIIVPPSSSLQQTTLIDLMRHQTTLKNLEKDLDSQLNPSSHELLQIFSRAKLDTMRHNVWDYSNMNIAFLGMIVERVSGRSYRDFVESQILRPLGLRDIFPSIKSMTAQDRERILVGHDLDSRGESMRVHLEDRDIFNASGGYVASASDIAVFFQQLLSGNILSPPYTQAMRNTSILVYPEKNWHYSLGLNHFPIERAGSDMVIGHAGERAGFASISTRYEPLDLTITVMTNGRNLPADTQHEFPGYTSPMAFEFVLFQSLKRAAAEVQQSPRIEKPTFPVLTEPLRRTSISVEFNPEANP